MAAIDVEAPAIRSNWRSCSKMPTKYSFLFAAFWYIVHCAPQSILKVSIGWSIPYTGRLLLRRVG